MEAFRAVRDAALTELDRAAAPRQSGGIVVAALQGR
jgi:hypothetical protein